jgi:hypothetical protein
MLTLRAQHFSKIKGIVQYIRKIGSVKPKDRFCKSEGELLQKGNEEPLARRSQCRMKNRRGASAIANT